MTPFGWAYAIRAALGCALAVTAIVAELSGDLARGRAALASWRDERRLRVAR